MTRKLRVLIVTNAIDLWKGGHCRNIHFLADHLTKQGVRVEVLAHQVGDNIDELASYEIHRASLDNDNSLLPKGVQFGLYARQFVASEGGRFDVLHANAATGFAISRLSCSSRPPLVMHFRAANFRRVFCLLQDPLVWRTFSFWPIIQTGFEWILDYISLRNCDYAFCNCLDTLESVLPFAPDPKKLSVLHNAVILPSDKELSSPRSKSSSMSIGYLANHHTLKGWLYFISIAKSLLEVSPNVHIHVAGDGPYSSHILPKLRASIPEDQLHIWGRLVGTSQKARFFNALNIYLCPSHAPTTVTEALSYDLPVVVAKQAHSPEDGMDLKPFVDCGAAELCLNSTPEEAAKRVSWHYKSDTTSAMKRARQILKADYNWDNVAEKAVEIYSTLV